MPCILAIDTGGTMAKAAVFTLDGTELASARQANDVQFPAPGHTEVDAEGMWRSASAAAQRALRDSGAAPRDVIGISTTGHGNGLYAVDRDGLPVCPGIVSTDSRADAIGRAWMAAGHGPAAEAVIMQRFWPGQTLPLLGWFARHRPAAFERAAAIFGSKDYIRARLTGDLSTEITEAACSGLADLRTGHYAHELFARFGFAHLGDKLPPIRPSLEAAAGLSRAAAETLGLPPGIPVVRGLTDVVACAVASGADNPDVMSVIAGTFSINQTLHREPRRSRAPTLQLPYPVGDLFLATECAATSASNLEWLCRTVLDGEAARALAANRSIYDLVGDWVGDGLARENDILFLPFLFGGPDDAPAGLLGLKASHTLADIMLAVFEGIAFAHKLDVDKLMTGPDAGAPKVVRLAGGATRSPVWPQIFADVLDLPVEVPAGSELGAQGAALATATALGHYETLAAAMAATVRIDRRFEPDARRRDRLAGKYARFAAVVQALGQSRHFAETA